MLSAALLSACTGTSSTNSTASEETSAAEESSAAAAALSKIDMKKWQYNADDDVYYQLGVSYCASPADESYEKLAIFVPAAYMSGTDNGDGTFSCTLGDASVGNYTAATAPIVIPINTPGYSAMNALTEYTDVSAFTKEGFIYVYAGARGRNEGAPKRCCRL